MRIGICIPFYYNSEEAKERLIYLLETIKDQNFSDLCKIAVVVDGPDADFLKQYDGKYGIKVLYLSVHQGVSVARNVGIDYLQDKECRYIGFIDADDSISGDYIISAYEACETNEYDILDSRFVQNIEIFGTLEGRKKQNKTLRNGVTGVFIRNSLINNNRFDKNLSVGEDNDFINRVINLSRHTKGTFDGIYVYNYGVNPESIIMRAAQNRLTK